MYIKKILTVAATGALMSGALIAPAFADSVSVSFEQPTYVIADVNGQDGWTKTGSFDVSVDSSFGVAGFGTQSLRLSDALTSGSFGDQTFSKPLINSVGEAISTAGGFPVGIKQRHFEMRFDIASTVPGAQQPGMHMSVSPDRGDGSRMSYLRFEDNSDGIDVFFDDVQTTAPCTPSGCANFVETEVGTGLDRSIPHHVGLTLDTLDGPNNDIVKVYIDGNQVWTGTSWEDYYLYDPEAAAEPNPRIVRTVLFRESGTANSSDSGKGFLVDNLSLLSGLILVGPPTSAGQCKSNGWKTFNNPAFTNQGQCVSYVNANPHAGKQQPN